MNSKQTILGLMLLSTNQSDAQAKLLWSVAMLLRQKTLIYSNKP